MFSVSFTNWVLRTIFVFCPFWVAKQVFSLKNIKLFLETENKRKKQLPNIPLETFQKIWQNKSFAICILCKFLLIENNRNLAKGFVIQLAPNRDIKNSNSSQLLMYQNNNNPYTCILSLESYLSTQKKKKKLFMYHSILTKKSYVTTYLRSNRNR